MTGSDIFLLVWLTGMVPAGAFFMWKFHWLMPGEKYSSGLGLYVAIFWFTMLPMILFCNFWKWMEKKLLKR